VVGPSIIGAIIACSAANELQVPYSLTYRSKQDQSIDFHRGFVPEKGSRALFVDDFVFSGKDLRDNIAFMQDRGVEVVGASVIGKRSEVPLDVPLRNLIDVDFQKTTPEDCGMCDAHMPVTASNIRE
jgi:orotate phosphoribosyltransferase